MGRFGTWQDPRVRHTHTTPPSSHPVIDVSRGFPRRVRDPMPLRRPRLEDTGDGEQREAWLNQCCLDSL
jgi:hypothetical protein